jgi:hypothetical protein
VGTARRGWIERSQVINAAPADQFLSRLHAKN